MRKTTEKSSNELLMMFINDCYSFSGKISKKTVLSTMAFVAQDSDLQIKVNNGDSKAILNHKGKL